MSVSPNKYIESVLFKQPYTDEHISKLVSCHHKYGLSSINIYPSELYLFASHNIKLNLFINFPTVELPPSITNDIMVHFTQTFDIGYFNIGVPYSLIQKNMWDKIPKLWELLNKDRFNIRPIILLDWLPNTNKYLDRLAQITEQIGWSSIIIGSTKNPSLSDNCELAFFTKKDVGISIGTMGTYYQDITFIHKNIIDHQIQPILLPDNNVLALFTL